MTEAIIVTVDSVRSRASTQETLLTLALPQEHAAKVAKFLCMIHQPVAVAFAEVEQDGHPKKPDDKQTKPFGKFATELHRLGWWFAPAVLAAIGTPEQYHEWIQRQPSAWSGEFSEYVNGEGRCIAAHFRSVALGSGTGIKPDYTEIPMTNSEHINQHEKGYGLYGGKDWFQKQREKYVRAWASETLARTLGCPSMGYVSPDQLRAWAVERNLEGTLPACYRDNE